MHTRDGSFGIGRDGAFEVRQLGADGHFALVGELDMAAVDDLFAGLRGAINRGGTITLELRELTFLDVSGGHAIGVVGGMVAGRGSVVLEAPSQMVLKVLMLMGAEDFSGVHIAPLSQSA
jgi:anti-anti-sigma regulatory factor